MPETNLEIERKYEVDATVTVPDLVGVADITRVVEGGTHDLRAQYFDTADFDLAQRFCALRHRIGGNDAGWHVKVRTPEGVEETNWPTSTDDLDGTPASIPDSVREALGEFIADAPLAPIATISTQRTTVLFFRGEQAQPIAELADDLVTTVDARTQTQRSWREWEVELLGEWSPAEAEAFFAEVQQVLMKAGAEPSSLHAKLQRALGQG